MFELAVDIARLLNNWAVPKEQFRSLIYYIAERGNTSNPGLFLQEIAAKALDYQEDIMTIAELEAKGMQKGRQETTIEFAKKFLANGVDRSTVKLSTGLTDEQLDALTRQ